MKPEFVKMLADLGDTRFDRLAETLETTRPEVSVRLNPRKAGRQTSAASQAEAFSLANQGAMEGAEERGVGKEWRSR